MMVVVMMMMMMMMMMNEKVKFVEYSSTNFTSLFIIIIIIGRSRRTHRAL